MKKALLLLFVLSCLTLPARAAGFSDVPESHWAFEPVQQAVEAGVVNGYRDGSFRPGGEVTAAQFCAMMARSFVDPSSQPEGPDQIFNACLPVLKGTAVRDAYEENGYSWGEFINRPLSRYDAAQIVFNTAYEKGGLRDAVNVSTAEVADWKDIPERYRGTVLTCWGKGLLQGRSDGRFAGEEGVNRAQACVIWTRLDALLAGEAEGPEEGGEFEMPAFGLQGDETVQTMMRRINAATPPCEEGFLTNGKARTEENVQELLELVKAGCPDGTVWSGTERFDYKVSQLGTVQGGLAFGMAVSDFVFGEGAPLKLHQDFRSLSAGDVIHIKRGSAQRVLAVTAVDWEEDRFTACEVKNGKVHWDVWDPISGLVDDPNFTTVYSRR